MLKLRSCRAFKLKHIVLSHHKVPESKRNYVVLPMATENRVEVLSLLQVYVTSHHEFVWNLMEASSCHSSHL